MQPAFYDHTLSYEENYKKGPPVVSRKKPPKRTVKKTQKFLGFDVNTTFGMAAGPLPNSKFIKAAFEWGFDINHYKTQRSVPFAANAFPNVVFIDIDRKLTLKRAQKPLLGTMRTDRLPTEFTITNSFGNPSKGPKFWQKDMRKALKYQKRGQLMIASVVGTIQKGFSDLDYYDDFAKAAQLASETGVKVIEVNLSCPNVANEGVLCYSPKAVFEICKRVKQKIGNTPLLAKVGYYDKPQQDLLEKILKKALPFIAGIAAINTIPAPVVDKDGNQLLPGPNRLKSGICGAAIKWAGLDMVKRLVRLREKLHADFAIIGVGGVMTPDDHFEYKKAGADCVQAVTASMWNPYLAYSIWKKENKK